MFFLFFFAYRSSPHPWRLPRRGHGYAEGVHKESQPRTEVRCAQLGVPGKGKPMRSMALQTFSQTHFRWGTGWNISVITHQKNPPQVSFVSPVMHSRMYKYCGVQNIQNTSLSSALHVSMKYSRHQSLGPLFPLLTPVSHYREKKGRGSWGKFVDRTKIDATPYWEGVLNIWH